MVGIPDGLGAFDNGNGTFTVLMNHEIPNSNPALAGAVRAHGANGAFVSEWVIDKTTLQAPPVKDSMHDVLGLFDTVDADLRRPQCRVGQRRIVQPVLLGGLGRPKRLLQSGDRSRLQSRRRPPLPRRRREPNAEGRAMAHIVGGALGRQQLRARLARQHGLRESELANPFTGDKTVVGMLNDTAASGNNAPGTSAFSETIAARSTSTSATSRRPASRSTRPASPAAACTASKWQAWKSKTISPTKAVNGSHFDLVAVGDPHQHLRRRPQPPSGSAPPGDQ